jgi:hypothetical protein
MLLPHLLSLTLVLAAPPSSEKETPRKQSGIAPSLAALTLEEEDRLDAVIDRFIRYDTGQLRGEEGRQAKKDFEALGYDAIPALIRGLNRAAQLDHSCPTLVISTKLRKLLLASTDLQLLEFARDEIGAGVGRVKYAGNLQDLRVQCMLRKNALLRAGLGGPKTPRTMTTPELVKAAEKESGSRLKGLLTELEQRRGPEVFEGLSAAITNADREISGLATSLLERHLGRQTPGLVRQKLKDDNAEIRKAAIRAAAKVSGLVGDVIDCLNDGQTDVREAAHAVLVQLSKGEDFGPAQQAEAEERQQAIQKWRAWWQKQRR